VKDVKALPKIGHSLSGLDQPENPSAILEWFNQHKRKSMPDSRTEAYETEMLSQLFNSARGYQALDNRSLGSELIALNLLEEKNRRNPETIARFIVCSFTVSFLMLVNAWQWFLGGITLQRQIYLPAQYLQMLYYSIFFSCKSFLAAHLKGVYTVQIEIEEKRVSKTRKRLWLGKADGEDSIILAKIRGAEHQTTANWFYEVFKQWDLKLRHPGVLPFVDDTDFHVFLRNMYTYSLADIVEELKYPDPNNCPAPPANEVLFLLWRREDWDEYYPEEFWALEHLKVALDLHTQLLDKFDGRSPYTVYQANLVRNLYEHHRRTGLAEFLDEALGPILNYVGKHHQ
jgi:hypothetical protein